MLKIFSGSTWWPTERIRPQRDSRPEWRLSMMLKDRLEAIDDIACAVDKALRGGSTRCANIDVPGSNLSHEPCDRTLSIRVLYR